MQITRMRLVALALAGLLWSSVGLAQTGSILTPAALNTEINTLYPDNTAGQITPFKLRQVALDQVASVPFLNTANTFSALNTFSSGIVASSVNGNIWTAGTGTLTLGSGKTVTVNNTVTLNGVDGTTFSLPLLSASLAGLGINQTWTGTQSHTDGTLVLLGSSSGSSTLKAPATGGGTATLFAGSDTIVGRASTDTLTNKTFVCANQVSCIVRLGSDVTGQLPVANGGTGQTSITATLDAAFGSTQGNVLYRNATVWTVLAPGSSGQLLSSGGPAANISWITASGTGTVTSFGNVAGTATVSGTCTVTSSGTCPVVSQTTPTSWTPSDGSGAGLSFTSISANYTRVGNMVFAYANFTYPSTADASNDATVSGLPVTLPNVGYGNAPCSSTTLIASSGAVASAQTVQNTATFKFLNPSSGAFLKNVNLSLQTVRIVCVYPAT